MKQHTEPPLDSRDWHSLMGLDLERSEPQPLQPIQIGGESTLQISVQSMDVLGFLPGDRVRLALEEGRWLLRRTQQEGVVFRAGKTAKLAVSDEAVDKLSSCRAAGAVLVRREGTGEILPVRVEEHPADLLGPRFIDEIRGYCLVRHAIPGLPHESWTPEVLRNLEEMLCSEPLRVDPVSSIAQKEDWVGWMTRNRILGQPTRPDSQLGADLVAAIFHGQRRDGSWGAVPATAYAMLRLLVLGVPASDGRLQRAAGWLLGLPEPPPRPGMWMLTVEYLDEWLSKRQPKEQRDFAPGEFHWEPPDEERNFYCWVYPEREQDQFRAPEMQRVIPICARHHSPACEPRMTHVSALVAEALIRCGYADHPRVRRYINTVFHLGGEWGYWCGCGALGLYDADIPARGSAPDLDVRRVAQEGSCDLLPWRWITDAREAWVLANQPSLPERGTHLGPFSWYCVPGEERFFALLGTGWQNGDCWAKTNRALSGHPACPGSLTERLAIYQASRYQTSLGEWDQGFPAGMLSLLSLYSHGAAKSLVLKTVPWLREHQADDGLWHHEELARSEWGKLAEPPEPRLATYHVVSALRKFGVLDRLCP